MGCGEKRGDWGPFGGTCHICPTSIPWSLPVVRQGEEGVASCNAPPLPLHMQTCTLHPAAARTGRRKAESRAGAHFTLLPAACAPRFAALCHAASIAWSSPGFPSAASPAPRSHSGRGWESGSALLSTHPPLHRAPRAEARGAAPGVPPRFPQLLPPI